jgi:hypothetical protein
MKKTNRRFSKRRRSSLVKLLLVVLFAGLILTYLFLPTTTTYSAGEPNVFALTSSNVLIKFNAATPGAVTTIGAITGLVGGDTIVGIDIRPATGQLFGLGSGSRLYAIDAATAVATQVGVDGQFSLPPGQSFGFDFNPTVDRIRVTSDSEQNFRLNPNNGTRPGGVDDTTLTYPAAGGNFDTGGAAYTNNFSGATTTTLYDIDTATNNLVLQGGINGTPSPNLGVLTTVGPLGINPTDDLTRANTAFDILTTGTPGAPVNSGFAALTTNGTSSSLYTIDLNTGAATLVGAIGAAPTLIRGIAVIPQITTPPGTAYAIDAATNNLIRFNVGNPSTIISSIPITGLVGGDTVLGIDFRPATGELFALSSGSRLYTINPGTGAATQRGSDGQFTLSGQSFGFDFNPVPDRIRVVSDFEQNLRLNPNDGTLAGTDTSVAYDPTDPGFPTNPQLGGAAHTNSFSGATTTTLFGIETTRDVLVRQGGVNVPPGTPSPNGGRLFTVGSLGIAIPDTNGLPNGFDIQTQADGTNVAFAALTTNGTTTNLYSINLTTGAATQISATPIGGATPLLIRGFAIAPMGDFEFSAPTYSVGESGPVATITINRLRGIEGSVSVTFSTSDGTATAPADYTDSDQLVSFAPGQTSTTVTIPIVNEDFNEGNETINLALTNPAGGARLGPQSTAVLTITDDDPLQTANAYGVDLANNLVRFRTATPGAIITSTPITGLQAGETVLGIDLRPATGQLYALGSTSRLYVVNTNSGAATQVGTGTFAIPLSGGSFGFDFNPIADRIRVISDAEQNMRLDPNNGTVVDGDSVAAGTQADGNLNYVGGDPHVGADPNATGSAYTNSINGAATTTLFDIDTNLDILVVQNPPNPGGLNTVGPLNVDATSVLGFDIRGATNTGFASMVVGGTPRLYSINLATGAANLVGTIGPGAGTTLRAFALASEGFGNTTLVGTTATFGGSSTCESLVFDQSGGLLRHNRFSSGDPGFNSDFDFDPMTPGDQTLGSSNPAVTIIVNAGTCDDQITIGSASAPASGLAASFQINGQGGADSLVINDTADSTARTISITGATSTLSGLSGPVTYGTLESVTVNAGSGGDTINVLGTQAALTNVFGGGGNDTVAFGNAATLSGGLVDGGPGTNTLDYSAYTTAVSVDLSAAQAQTLFQAALSGAQEPGPLSSSPAAGTLAGTLNSAQTAFTFNIAYSGLTGAPISGTHFHNQVAGVNGPIVRGLFASEQNGLATPAGTFSGVWSNSDPTLDPPESDAPVRPLNAASPVTPGSTLLQELLAGRIYFNIHTLPNFPSGEIRGQVISQGTVNPAPGTAGVRSFDNVTGGSQNDTLVGNNNVNVLRGGPGIDTITGGPAGDQMFGDGDNDTLIWNNGDGSDLMEGGDGGDTVRVNGSTAGGDQFLIQVNPADATRLRFDRTNLGLFNLNIGTTEALNFNTLDGDDTTTVDYAGGNPIPSGISGGPGLSFDGGTGSDLLVLQRSAGSFSAAAETYTATGPGAGDIALAGGLIRFSNLTPVNDTVPVTNFTFTAPAASAALNVINGPVVSGFNTTQVNDLGSASFELINFANKTNVTLNSGTGSSIVSINNPVPASGLTMLTANGSPSSDSFSVKASASVTINLNGGSPLVAPGDQLNYDAEGRTVSGDSTPPDGTINSPGVQPVNFTGMEAVNLNGVPLSISDVTVTETNAGSVNAVFTVSLPLATSQTVMVDYVTSNGNATAPEDYAAVSGTLTFAPGVTSRTITVPVNGDTVPEPTETFSVDLSNPSNATIADGHGVGTINDNDASGNFQFAAATATVAESSNTVAIAITRTGDTSGAASVRYETSDVTAQQKGDYTFASGLVQFGPGETSKTVNISLINDVFVEGTETFQVTLSNPSGSFVIGNPSPEIITITDDDLVPPTANPIDNTQFFVRLHYLDFLGREPDAGGLAFWTNNIESCGADANCREVKRIDTSAAFFLSIEFQETGGNVIRTRRVAFGQLSADPGSRVAYLDFMRESRQIGEGVIVGQAGYQTILEQNKQTYAQQIVANPEFLERFPISSGASYVDALAASAGIVLTSDERTAAINAFGAGGNAGRVAALRSVADSNTLRTAEFSPSFVLAQYFGYLRRNPIDPPDSNDSGYQFWLSKLNSFNGDYRRAEMVKAFISSTEYRRRVGP